MGTLENVRWEMFAQHVANGKSGADAYVLAGFKPNKANASRLKSTEPLRRRIAELIEAKARPIAQTHVTKDWVLASLLTVAERCMGKTVTIKGREVQYRFDSAGANRALELLGKELGMFVERVEQDTNIRVISAQPVSEADWEAKYGRMIEGKKTN